MKSCYNIKPTSYFVQLKPNKLILSIVFFVLLDKILLLNSGMELMMKWSCCGSGPSRSCHHWSLESSRSCWRPQLWSGFKLVAEAATGVKVLPAPEEPQWNQTLFSIWGWGGGGGEVLRDEGGQSLTSHDSPPDQSLAPPAGLLLQMWVSR